MSEATAPVLAWKRALCSPWGSGQSTDAIRAYVAPGKSCRSRSDQRRSGAWSSSLNRMDEATIHWPGCKSGARPPHTPKLMIPRLCRPIAASKMAGVRRPSLMMASSPAMRASNERPVSAITDLLFARALWRSKIRSMPACPRPWLHSSRATVNTRGPFLEAWVWITRRIILQLLAEEQAALKRDDTPL